MMAVSCKPRAFLSTDVYVQYCGESVQSPKFELPFRPGTNVSLVLTKEPHLSNAYVKITIEGSAHGLKAKMWVLDEEGRDLVPRWNAQLNKDYWTSGLLKHRVFCRVWTDDCPLCADDAEQKAAHEKELQTLRSQLKQSEDRVAVQQLQTRVSQNVLQSRVQQLEQGTADNERKLAAAVNENESIKQELAAEIFGLKLALEQQKVAGEAAVVNAKLASVENANEAFMEERKKLAADIAELTAALEEQTTSTEAAAKEVSSLEKEFLLTHPFTSTRLFSLLLFAQ
ncbi:hypothetical protein M3Y99_01058000 [Aphelenchoides fujianensis]|nr:hypothetical protein M3Y99_01058000 [Aphelenchoides fujianensis]